MFAVPWRGSVVFFLGFFGLLCSGALDRTFSSTPTGVGPHLPLPSVLFNSPPPIQKFSCSTPSGADHSFHVYSTSVMMLFFFLLRLVSLWRDDLFLGLFDCTSFFLFFPGHVVTPGGFGGGRIASSFSRYRCTTSPARVEAVFF